MGGGNTMGAGDPGGEAASVFDNTATISKNVELKGSLTLIDPLRNISREMTDLDITKLIGITDGIAYHGKCLVLNSSKNISGINSQDNFGIFTLSQATNSENDNFFFRRSRGSTYNISEAYHNDKIGSIMFSPLLSDKASYANSASIYSRVVGKTLNISSSITEDGTIGSNTTNTSNTAILSSSANPSDNYYNWWIIETVNPNYKKIITDYNGSTKTITTSSTFTTTTTSTTYVLTSGTTGGIMQAEKRLATSDSGTDNYYNNLTITVDVNGTIATGTITSYNGTTKGITTIFNPAVITDNTTVYTLSENSQYMGSEILFKTTGVGTDTFNDDSLK